MRSPESHGNVRDSQRSKGQKKKAKDMDSVKRKGSVKKITSRNNTPHAHATSPAVLSPVPQNANRQPGEANGYVFIVPKGAVGANQQHPSPGGTPGVTNQSPAIDPFFVPPGTANANPNPQVQASVPAVNPTQQADTGDGHYENFLPMALRK